MRAGQMPAGLLGQLAYERALEICWKSTLVLLLWAGIDYLLQRQKLERDLRMSKQDLRDEYRRRRETPQSRHGCAGCSARCGAAAC